MVYLDLAELDSAFRGRWLWSTRRPALARFDRRDYLGDPGVPLDQAVRDRVEQETGSRPDGPIRMLTHLRYFGFCFNPVTFYYCFDQAGQRVDTIVAEITNTPWKERHAYVLPTSRRRGPVQRFRFRKQFHVSPFLDMAIDYDWFFSPPDQRLHVHMEDHQQDNKLFDATLKLARHPITGWNLARALVAFPLMTTQVIIGIYWQALRLWLRRTPIYDHPRHRPSTPDRHTVTPT